MDRIKRKLKLFDIKYYDIDNDIHIIPSINQHIKNQEKKHQKQSNLHFNEYNSHKPKTEPHSKENDFFIYKALLAIEETAIFIIEKTPLDYFYEKNVDFYHALVLDETNIVENIEIALLKIKNDSTLKNKSIKIIQPIKNRKNIIVFFKKNQQKPHQ
ncbi:hypothetical protein KDX31_16415 [Amphritea atlantica]|uniref:Uncharacterized protein n=1 Tax=Amphritea atlantica TaxID=355243 RepID=A0ABY5GUG8_9GAMM|nr:hypothetical protein KDX31_16415 [Amphritea atlantica]